MKNRPLSFQLWFMISLLVFTVLVVIFGVMNLSVRNFFEKQTFDTIEFAQGNRISSLEERSGFSIEDDEDILDLSSSASAKEYERSVNHLFITAKRLQTSQPVLMKNTNMPFISKVRNVILTQEDTTKRYIFKTDQQIYCVVTKTVLKDQEFFLISYMTETYTKGLVQSMNTTILYVLVASLLISSFIARFIANRITKPLKAVEIQLSHIAHKEWQEDLELNRKDEIGRLATSANIMQTTLQEKDIEEKNFIQTVSHDMKTPIMVIRSYAQAVLDGVIPLEDIQSSIQLIDNEAIKMDDKIKDLIYLYTLRNQPVAYDNFESVNSISYLNDLIKRFQYTTDAIEFKSTVDDSYMTINRKTFTVAIENILENALRFATSVIQLNCSTIGKELIIQIYNDGSHLENPERIFDRYETESRGNTGLGMAITKEIIENHKGQILAQNEENGVSFIIKLPNLL